MCHLVLIVYLLLNVGHKDSVTCASFSNDGLFVATGDMSGLIKVWQLSDHSEVWSFEVADLEVSVTSS